MKWGVRRFQNKDGTRIKRNRHDLWSDDAQTAKSLKKKNVNQMSNAELRKLNERQNLEKQYRSMNKSRIAKGVAFVASATAVTNTAVNLYNNSSKLVGLGKSAGDKIVNVAGNMVMRDLNRSFRR